MHEQICQSSPSSSVFNAAISTALPPSQRNTKQGSSAGQGRRGGSPQRQRVGLPPPNPCDSSSSSSDDDLGPERRIPNASRRNRREGRQPEKKDKDKADQLFQALYDQLVQPTTVEIHRKYKIPEMKAHQIFTRKDKTLFCAWWMLVQDYVETYSSAFPDENAQVK
jgi:hypothetical protein